MSSLEAIQQELLEYRMDLERLQRSPSAQVLPVKDALRLLDILDRWLEVDATRAQQPSMDPLTADAGNVLYCDRCHKRRDDLVPFERDESTEFVCSECRDTPRYKFVAPTIEQLNALDEGDSDVAAGTLCDRFDLGEKSKRYAVLATTAARSIANKHFAPQFLPGNDNDASPQIATVYDPVLLEKDHTIADLHDTLNMALETHRDEVLQLNKLIVGLQSEIKVLTADYKAVSDAFDPVHAKYATYPGRRLAEMVADAVSDLGAIRQEHERLRQEIAANLASVPEKDRILVREGGAAEDDCKSLAVSIASMQRRQQRMLKRLNESRVLLSWLVTWWGGFSGSELHSDQLPHLKQFINECQEFLKTQE